MLRIVTEGALCQDSSENGPIVVENDDNGPVIAENGAAAVAALTVPEFLESRAVEIRLAAVLAPVSGPRAAELSVAELAEFDTAAGGGDGAPLLPEDAALIRLWQTDAIDPAAARTPVAAAVDRESAAGQAADLTEQAATGGYSGNFGGSNEGLPEDGALLALWRGGEDAVAELAAEIAAETLSKKTTPSVEARKEDRAAGGEHARAPKPAQNTEFVLAAVAGEDSLAAAGRVGLPAPGRRPAGIELAMTPDGDGPGPLRWRGPPVQGVGSAGLLDHAPPDRLGQGGLNHAQAPP